MTFARTSGEWIDGDPLEYSCPWCGARSCDCEEEIGPPQSRWSTLTPEEREAELQAIYAKIDEAFAWKVERDLRFTIEMQKRDAA